MAYFVEVYCRLAIRLCVGYHANGRERYRTMNIWNVRRDATAEQIAAFVRALEPLLDGRVVRVLLVRKDRLVMGGVAGDARVADSQEYTGTGSKGRKFCAPRSDINFTMVQGTADTRSAFELPTPGDSWMGVFDL